MTTETLSNSLVSAAVEKGRRAAVSWGATPVRARVALLRQLRLRIVDNADALVAGIVSATGKPPSEALTNEIVPTLELLRFHEKHAVHLLARERRPTPFLFPRSHSYVEYHPRGMVVVLGPSNFPFQLCAAPAITALAAGNSVIVKVSEYAAGLAPLFSGLFQDAGFPPDAAQFISGPAALGEQLAASKPDLIFLTGSGDTGRRVMSIAAETLTPVILELGGKDPMIVFSDAPFDRTVRGAVYGGFANAGQVCVSVDRILVERPLFDQFSKAVAEQAAQLPVGSDAGAAFGPLASDNHVNRFRALLDDAVSKGARLLTPFDIQGRNVKPVVLTGVNSDMRVWHEEVFGPLVSIIPFDSEDQAVNLANESRFGLSASVWTRDLNRGQRVLGRLAVGSGGVNDVIKFIGNPHLPFGGVKQSGIGVYHGPEGLRAFSRPMSVMVNRGWWKREPNWFPYSAKGFEGLKLMVTALYGGGSPLQRLRRLILLGRKMRRGSND